jgi:hypothetical protein
VILSFPSSSFKVKHVATVRVVSVAVSLLPLVSKLEMMSISCGLPHETVKLVIVSAMTSITCDTSPLEEKEKGRKRRQGSE